MAGACVAILLMMIMVRLANVQLHQSNWINEKAEESWKRDIPMVAKRGKVIDRNGEALTYDVTRPTVMAIPVQMIEKEKTAIALSGILHVPIAQIADDFKRKQFIVNIRPGGRNITTAQAREIQKLRLPGIVVAEDSQRFYPFGRLAAHVLGFTGGDHQGLTGLERNYDEHLSGINGSYSFFADAAGRNIPGMPLTVQPSRDGLDLQVSLDRTIQTIVERELDQAMITTRAEKAIAIVMDPNNGEILAMSSRPTFDPTKARQEPVEVTNRNLPVWMTYEPGSTFKILTLAAALEEHVVDLDRERIHDPGYIQVAGARLRCWKRQGHGTETFLQVVQNSCNPGFVTMGQRLGKDRLLGYVKKFGFGKRTGIDLPGEENGIIFKPSRVGPVELSTISFGQGVSVTPIQQAAAVSAAVNGGTWHQPHFGLRWLDPKSGKELAKLPVPKGERVISQAVSEQVRLALESVVAQGTGRNAFIDGYRVGGKTGTAQKVIGGKYSSDAYIVSFVGFAPANAPKVLVYTAVDHPQGIQFGGVVAAPIVRNILKDTLPYLKIPLQSEGLAMEHRPGDVMITVQVPDWTGMTLTELIENGDAASDLKVESIGNGTKVVHQSPAPGSYVPSGSIVRVYLN